MQRFFVNNFLRTVCFVGIFIILFGMCQAILQPNLFNRDPGGASTSGDVVMEWDQLVNDGVRIQVVTIGKSGFNWEIDPMGIYKKTGITVYNMSSAAQPLPISYFLCGEALKTQSPELIIVDATEAYEGEFASGLYHGVMDLFPVSNRKIVLARQYAEGFDEDKRKDAFLAALSPFYQYHDRWDSLSKNDFAVAVKTDQFLMGNGFSKAADYSEMNEFLKGYALQSTITGTGMNIDWMDDLAAQANSNIDMMIRYEGGDAIQSSTDASPLYDPRIDEENWLLIKDMKKACDEKGIHFLLMKTPHFEHPLGSASVWTKLKSDRLKERAEQDGIDFLDLQYDADLGIEWNIEAGAGSSHLNYAGTRKVTDYLVNLFEEQYGLHGGVCEAYEEDIPIYDKVCRLAELSLTADFFQYMDKVSQVENSTVFFSAADNMAFGLSPEICRTLNEFGLQADFSSFNYSDAYLAIVENGQIRQESCSNRSITSEGTLENGQKYSVSSSGFLAGSKSSVLIDGTEYSLNRRGLNIVVLDNVSGIVLDSVCFDMHDPEKATSAIRENTLKQNAIWQYEEYLMKQDAENGIGVY